jgi:RHS repeat-associated protein
LSAGETGSGGLRPDRRSWRHFGSTTELADGGGTVTDTYRYDAFGALRSHVGASANEWLFTGEQRDAQSGFYYLRARYYDPAIGRLLTRDPWLGFPAQPQTLNPYPYVGNDPLSFVDVTGFCKRSWNPRDWVDCPLQPLHNDKVQKGVVLTSDVFAIAFTGSSAVITDLAAGAGCIVPGLGCAGGYLLGYGATYYLRVVGNAASGVSTAVGCLGDGKEAGKNCGFSVADTLVGALVREPNLGTAADIYQFCRDLGRCGP